MYLIANSQKAKKKKKINFILIVHCLYSSWYPFSRARGLLNKKKQNKDKYTNKLVNSSATEIFTKSIKNKFKNNYTRKRLDLPFIIYKAFKRSQASSRIVKF